MPCDLRDKSTLVQVMAGCREASRHYLKQCWPSFVLSSRASGINEGLIQNLTKPPNSMAIYLLYNGVFYTPTHPSCWGVYWLHYVCPCLSTHPACCLRSGSLPISWIVLLCGTNTTHEGLMTLCQASKLTKNSVWLLNIFKHCHLRYLNLKMYSLI